jgi:hypothetical protein
MVVAFEDNEKSSISRLLTHAYSMDDKVTLAFLKGNRKIADYIKAIDTSKTAIIYIDVVPDKYETVEEYNRCIKVICDNKLKGVYVIPVPCIEYFVIKAFLDRKNSEVDCVLNGLNYKLFGKNDRGYKLSTKDFENYCKSVVYNYQNCFRNGGDFYLQDCLCQKGGQLEACKEYSLDEKACKLVCTLPVFYNMSTGDKFETNIVNIKDVIGKRVQEYYELAYKYVEYGIIRNIYKLREYDFGA